MASPDTGTSTVARPGPAATRTTGSNPFNAAVPMILLVGLVALPAILGPQIASGFFDVLDSLAATTPAIVASGYRGIGGPGAGAGAGNATAAAGGAVSGVSGGVDQWIAPVAARKHFVPPWLPFAAAVREGIDAWLTGLVAFFWVTVRSGDARLSLFAAYMAGQLVPGHAAVMLEGMRHGNEGRWISFSTLIGCLYQCIPWGFMLPLYKALYLITSPLAFAPTARALGVADHKAQLAALPLSLAVGLVVPTILNALPEPWSSPFAQQGWLAFWQFFPLWVAACQETAAFIARFFVGGDGSPATLLPSLRRAYMFPLAVGAAVHWGVILLSINPAFFAPLLALVPGGVVLPAMPSLAAIFVPKLKPAPDGDLLVHGCLTLLQADMYCAGAAALLWACALRRPGLFAPSDPRKRVGGSAGRVRAMAGLFGSALIRTLLLGPFGAALELLWERDEAVLKENADAAVAKKGQ